MIYNQVLDLYFRTNTLFLLTSISTFEILLSSESGLIIPISILFINILLNFLIYLQFGKLSENFMMIFLSLFIIVIVTSYKRKTNEYNRRSFIQ